MALLGSNSNCRIEQGVWTFKDQYPIAYERASKVDIDSVGTAISHTSEDRVLGSEADDPVLLLNGFGMGSFHQHRLMTELLLSDNDERKPRVIFGMDYLGQGKSWPLDCNDGNSPSEQGLRYCGQTWVDQIIQFIELKILGTEGRLISARETPNETDQTALSDSRETPRKVHLVGNSVGGYLAVCVAASRPDLVASLCLLNATPIWGLNLPGWSGHLPAPIIPKRIGRFLFDRMRDYSTIQQFLLSTYVNPSAFDTSLVEQIRSTTEGRGGHAAFASILWSPPVTVELPSEALTDDYYDCLEQIKCDVLLVFGRDDPWCKPAFAKRMLQSLQKRDLCSSGVLSQRFVELSNVGHCPNHEAPKATAFVLR